MRRRRTFKPEFKARVVLEELTGVKTAGQICREHQLRPQVFARWRAELAGRAPAGPMPLCASARAADYQHARLKEQVTEELRAEFEAEGNMFLCHNRHGEAEGVKKAIEAGLHARYLYRVMGG